MLKHQRERERERERELFSSRIQIPERRASDRDLAFRRLPKGGQRYSLIGGNSYGC